MKILWFSCGVTSAVACKLALEKYGKDDCIVVYINIGTAHPDNVRFISECEKWYGCKVYQFESEDFKDQFDVIRRTKYVNGASGARCTLELKKKVRWAIEAMCVGEISGQVFGFEYTKKEVNRAIRFKEQYPDSKPLFPLIDAKMTKPNCLSLLIREGVEIPKIYQLGYPNNNCIGCVKGGMGYWNKIREDFPDVFKEMSEMETLVGRSCIKGTFLKDLEPGRGHEQLPIMPDCGTFCEVEFADIIDPEVEKLFPNE